MTQTKLRSAPEATVDPGLVGTSGVQTGVYGQSTVTPTLSASVTSSIGGTTNLTSTSSMSCVSWGPLRYWHARHLQYGREHSTPYALVAYVKAEEAHYNG